MVGMGHKSTPSLLSEVNDFLSKTGMGVSYFGKVASGNSELVHRLRSGGRVWPETDEKVRAFMTAHIAEAAKASEDAA